MPEGPEIARAANALQRCLVDRPLTMRLLHPKLRAKSRALRGAQIVRVYARSKAMLTEFSNGLVLYSHNQLYGEWRIESLDAPMLDRQVRLAFSTPTQRAVLYSATDFAWLRAGSESRHPYLAKLGIEVLDGSVSRAEIAQQLAAFPRRVVADALLDQSVLAGLGNYLRADALFVAKVAPLARIGDLSARALMRLADACKRLSTLSYTHAGVVRPLNAYREARRELIASGLTAEVAHERARFYVFDREGQACWQSGSRVQRINRGGRGIFFCATCQETS
jgi:endonuclease VIII